MAARPAPQIALVRVSEVDVSELELVIRPVRVGVGERFGEMLAELAIRGLSQRLGAGLIEGIAPLTLVRRRLVVQHLLAQVLVVVVVPRPFQPVVQMSEGAVGIAETAGHDAAIRPAVHVHPRHHAKHIRLLEIELDRLNRPVLRIHPYSSCPYFPLSLTDVAQWAVNETRESSCAASVPRSDRRSRFIRYHVLRAMITLSRRRCGPKWRSMATMYPLPSHNRTARSV